MARERHTTSDVPQRIYPASEDFEVCRERSSMAIVEGFRRALAELHPADAEERAWVTGCLRDAYVAAGLSPVA